mmetsp:Transcript_64374/g.118630  ORF Transcript_64374/g.118630 Transcript_64374/m.118630 type:complete len:119 (+) Transcript_64374:31-387(+)
MHETDGSHDVSPNTFHGMQHSQVRENSLCIIRITFNGAVLSDWLTVHLVLAAWIHQHLRYMGHFFVKQNVLRRAMPISSACMKSQREVTTWKRRRFEGPTKADCIMLGLISSKPQLTR